MTDIPSGNVVGGWKITRRRNNALRFSAICPACEEEITDELEFFEQNSVCLSCCPDGPGRRIEDVESGRVYPSIRAAAQVLGFKASNFPARAKDGTVTWHGKTYRYVEHVPKIEVVPTKTIKAVKKVGTDEVYESVEDAAIANEGLKAHLIRKAARSGKLYGGFYWVYV